MGVVCVASLEHPASATTASAASTILMKALSLRDAIHDTEGGGSAVPATS